MDIFEIFNIYRPLYNTPPAWKTKTYMPFEEVCECLETAYIYAPILGCFEHQSWLDWSRMTICTVVMWYLVKNMTQLLKSPAYIYNYGELLLWQLSDHICLTQWSLASSLVLPILSYWWLFCSCGKVCRSLCFGTIVVFTICKIIKLMCTILLIPNSRIRFWNITSSYLSDGNISKQFSALIVFCDVICSYLCILLMRFTTSDLWHEKWLSAPCALRAVTWLVYPDCVWCIKAICLINLHNLLTVLLSCL